MAGPRAPFGQPAPYTSHGAPAGTFAPETKVQVGNHRVVIEKYLSEGGFAHVYVVRLPKPVDGNDRAVLKRVAVPDKEHLANMRTEVETMKKLKGHRHIVRYIDSHASQLKGGGYEVFLLMEYCSGGGLIDFMNTRLRNRLTEPEILKIFTDVAEGLACMHYLRPPLLHRDLKVENVLISLSGGSKIYKLCDFGSTAPPRPAATTAAEGRLIEDDIQRHTTLQYRSPEMIDVYRKQPIDEKSDIWALGVFLYKLCYYTTPFEEQGQMAILNARFKYPAHPVFSDNLKMVIATMLRENPAKRPNLYQILFQVCAMQGRECPVRDIYVNRSQSESRRTQELPSAHTGTLTAGATLSPPPEQKVASIPEIAPMRRGRPTKSVSHHGSARPSPSPLRMMDSSDPFASLDGKKDAGDELSTKFPTLDQFSLLSEKGKFEFEPPSSTTTTKTEQQKADLSQRVVNALADEAFARPPSPEKPKSMKMAPPVSSPSSRVLLDHSSHETKVGRPQVGTSIPQEPRQPLMVSTGTMTSPSPPPSLKERPIYRFPSSDRAQRTTSLPQTSDAGRPTSTSANKGSRLASLLSEDAAKSQQPQLSKLDEPKSPSSSRPSLEGGRPSFAESDTGVGRSKSMTSRSRPASANIASRLDFYRARRSSKHSTEDDTQPRNAEVPTSTSFESDTNIASDVDFLRSKEEEEKTWKAHKRQSSGSAHKKRTSLTSISLSGTKNLLAGRFGDAFRKFEGGNNGSGRRSGSESPSQEPINLLSPIAGSEGTDLSDDRHGLEETEELSPEMRREMERRRLSAEEKRVADAAAEYKKRLAGKGTERGRDPMRAMAIQNKVQSLLKENDKEVPSHAEGYGRFTNSAASQMKQYEDPRSGTQPTRPPVAHKPIIHSPNIGLKSPSEEPFASKVSPYRSSTPSDPRSSPKPAAPPKPKNMRGGGGEALSPTPGLGLSQDSENASPTDWEVTFNNRYPSLSGLGMVETEIDPSPSGPIRTKEI